jgi:hypothetical protein
MSPSCSRRRFLTYSTATAAGAFVLGDGRVLQAMPLEDCVEEGVVTAPATGAATPR